MALMRKFQALLLSSQLKGEKKRKEEKASHGLQSHKNMVIYITSLNDNEEFSNKVNEIDATSATNAQ